MTKGELNEKQEKFCQKYALLGNASGSVVAEVEAQYKYAKAHGHTSSALKALEILSKIRGNKSETKSLSEEAIHASLVGSFYVLGRKTVMGLMSEAEALGSQAVVNANQYK